MTFTWPEMDILALLITLTFSSHEKMCEKLPNPSGQSSRVHDFCYKLSHYAIDRSWLLDGSGMTGQHFAVGNFIFKEVHEYLLSPYG